MNILSGLYNYQQDAVRSTDLEPKGIIVMPTGTGKTMVQSGIIAKDIFMNRNQFRIYVINAPRIILTYQLLREVFKFLTERGIEARYHFTHSGSMVDEEDLESIRVESNLDGNNIPFSEIDSTTSSHRLLDVMVKTREQELPLIIFSTYNSANVIEDARKQIKFPVSILINDEGHYLVQERFHEVLNTLKTSRTYSFTATLRNTKSENGLGMNNMLAYGKKIFSITPRECIDRGKMVRPRLHIFRTNGVYSSLDFDKSLNSIIFNAFHSHKQLLENIHPTISPKLLISTRGTEDMKNFISSNYYNQLRESGVDIFTISSHEEIANDFNGKKVKRQEFLQTLREYGMDRNRMIMVLHYDILTEGVDVLGMNACLPLRSLAKYKFLQLYGRVSRLDPEDRKKLDNGEIGPHDLDMFNKPYAYVLLPWITEINKDDSEFIKGIVQELREYGFDSSEDIVGDFNPKGINEEVTMDVSSTPTRNIRTTGNLIDEVLSEIEDESIARLTPLEYLHQHLELN